MKYPKEYLDEIKTRLKVSTVVSKSVVLKKDNPSWLVTSVKFEKKIDFEKLYNQKFN